MKPASLCLLLLPIFTVGCGNETSPNGTSQPEPAVKEAAPSVVKRSEKRSPQGGDAKSSREMNETEAYIAEQIRLKVWSGFFDSEQAQNMITELLEKDSDEAMLRSLVDEEFSRKYQAEESWPKVTEYDKLREVFRRLRAKGVIAVHNAGWDMSEAFHSSLEAYRAAGEPKELYGTCYYTAQDVDRAVQGEGLYLGFGSTRAEDEAVDAPRAAAVIVEELKAAGLAVEWDGKTSSRLKVEMKWEVRGNGGPSR